MSRQSVPSPRRVQLIHDDTASWRPPYAYAALAPADHVLVFTAGSCPLDDDGTIVTPGDAVAQARRVMTNLRAALASAGADLADVVKSTVYVASPERDVLTAVWDVVCAAFGEHDAPSTLLGVAVLGWPGQLVEFEAVAALPRRRAGRGTARRPRPLPRRLRRSG